MERRTWTLALLAAIGCGGPTTAAIQETFRQVTPLAANEAQEDCFNRVKQSVLDGQLELEAYEATLRSECGLGESTDGGEGTSGGESTAPTPEEPAPDPSRVECYNAVKATAIAEGWTGERYEAELVAQCDGAASEGS